MVHGGIDGFSRLIVFLQCSSNNKSSTVLHAFRSGVQQYGLPQRIRSDRGGENVEVINHSNHGNVLLCHITILFRLQSLCSHIQLSITQLSLDHLCIMFG